MKSKCEILLLYPPFFRLLGEYRAWYPLGVGYLASYLNSYSISTKVYNADAELFKNEKIISYKEKFYKSKGMFSKKNENKKIIFDELEKVIKTLQPKIIGITVLTENIPIINDIISLIHKISPNVIIVIGGPHTIASKNVINEIHNWDYIIVGEAEESFLKLAKVILHCGNKIKFNEINGLIYRENDKILKNKESAIIECLDDLPFPDLRDMYLFNIDQQGMFNKAMISTSRGCPFKCTFCYMNAYNKMRFRSPENVIKEIQVNHDLYNITKYYILDDSFGTKKSFLDKFCDLVQQLSFNVKWSCMSHEKLITTERLDHMKKAGCDSIHLGIESGSNRVLDLLGKKTNIEKIEEKCRSINESGIKLKAFLMVGIPTETENDIINTMELLKKIRPHEAILQIYVPYPNTKLYDYINENICDITEFYNWNNFFKAKINYEMINEIHQKKFDCLIEDFFDLVEEINEKNKVYEPPAK